MSTYLLNLSATSEEKVGRYYTDEQNRGSFIIYAYSFYKSKFIVTDTSQYKYKVVQRISILKKYG
jgi:hypothetical protein